jgi:hypothetical protein
MEVTFRRATNADGPIAQQIVDRALRDYGLHVVLEAGDRTWWTSSSTTMPGAVASS